MVALECDWSLWEVPGALSVPGKGQRCLGLPLSPRGREGTGAVLQFAFSRTQISQCCMPRAQGGSRSSCSQLGLAAPLGIPMRGSMPGVPNQALALFSVRCGSAL